MVEAKHSEANPRAPTLEDLARTPPDRQKRQSALRDVVSSHYDLILRAREHGHRYSRIAEALKTSTGIVIAAETLRKYLSEETRLRQQAETVEATQLKPARSPITKQRPNQLAATLAETETKVPSTPALPARFFTPNPSLAATEDEFSL